MNVTCQSKSICCLLDRITLDFGTNGFRSSLWNLIWSYIEVLCVLVACGACHLKSVGKESLSWSLDYTFLSGKQILSNKRDTVLSAKHLLELFPNKEFWCNFSNTNKLSSYCIPAWGRKIKRGGSSRINTNSCDTQKDTNWPVNAC